MRNKNGFTLVELLAVIVVLAIIMVIAIPSVMEVMNSARKSSFVLYAEKVIKDTQISYVYDSGGGGTISGAGYFVYDITSDLGYASTGEYKGYIIVNATDVDNPEYILYLYDKNYMITNYNVTKFGMPTVDGGQIYSLDQAAVNKVAGSSALACEATAGTGVSCYNKNGYVIVKGD